MQKTVLHPVVAGDAIVRDLTHKEILRPDAIASVG
jgi:hypothetical protein